MSNSFQTHNKTVFTWVVDSFTQLKTNPFKNFTFNNDQGKPIEFCINLFPKGLPDYFTNYTLINVLQATPDEGKYQCRVAILNANASEWLSIESQIENKRINGIDYNYTSPHLMTQQSCLLAAKSAVLPDDKLTIWCEVSQLENKPTLPHVILLNDN